MGTGLERTSFQIRQTDTRRGSRPLITKGQKPRPAGDTTSRLSERSLYGDRPRNSVGENVERDRHRAAAGMQTAASVERPSGSARNKSSMELASDAPILLLGVYPTEGEAELERHGHTRIQSSFSTDQLRSARATEHGSAPRSREILRRATACMDPEE